MLMGKEFGSIPKRCCLEREEAVPCGSGFERCLVSRWIITRTHEEMQMDRLAMNFNQWLSDCQSGNLALLVVWVAAPISGERSFPTRAFHATRPAASRTMCIGGTDVLMEQVCRSNEQKSRESTLRRRRSLSLAFQEFQSKVRVIREPNLSSASRCNHFLNRDSSRNLSG
jgi:hypothetical protein